MLAVWKSAESAGTPGWGGVQLRGQGSQREPGLQKEATKTCPPALEMSRGKGLLAGHAKTPCPGPVAGASPQCPLASEGTAGKLSCRVRRLRWEHQELCTPSPRWPWCPGKRTGFDYLNETREGVRETPKDKAAIQGRPRDESAQSPQASQTHISSREVSPTTCPWAGKLSPLPGSSERPA